MSTFIPSLITPGKHFSIGVHKPQGRPAYAYATEGTVESHNDGRITGFSYMIPGARMHRAMLDGNNTKSNRAKAVSRLMADLVEQGWVKAEDAMNVSVEA